MEASCASLVAIQQLVMVEEAICAKCLQTDRQTDGQTDGRSDKLIPLRNELKIDVLN